MINIARMPKNEIIARANWRCPLKGHSYHNGLEHPNCFDKLNGVRERIGFLDCETEDLYGDFGIMFCWSLLDSETDKVYKDVITLKDIKKYSTKNRYDSPKEDKRIIRSLVYTLERNNYSRVITHYGSRFDLPMIRTRAVICKEYFPGYGQLYQTDTWLILKNKFKLRRNTLENGCRQLVGSSRKDHLSLSIKHACLRGEKWALDIALNHCVNDVLDLKDLFINTNKFVRNTKSSI